MELPKRLQSPHEPGSPSRRMFHEPGVALQQIRSQSALPADQLQTVHLCSGHERGEKLYGHAICSNTLDGGCILLGAERPQGAPNLGEPPPGDRRRKINVVADQIEQDPSAFGGRGPPALDSLRSPLEASLDSYELTQLACGNPADSSLEDRVPAKVESHGTRRARGIPSSDSGPATFHVCRQRLLDIHMPAGLEGGTGSLSMNRCR